MGKKLKQSTELQKIDTTNLVDEKYLTIEQVCQFLQCHRNTADALCKQCKDIKVGNCNRKYYNIKEIEQIQVSQQQQQLVKLNNKATTMNNKYSFDELKIAFGKSLENQSSKEIGNLGLQLIAIAMNKQNEAFAKENEEKDELLRQLEEKNKELQAYQNENKYIQETRHKIDVLKAKITKAVRTKAYQNKWTYKETYIRYYKIYDEAHNFPYKEDYNGYINLVEKRGHLLELYNIIINDF
jgi:hypothetical protein